VEVCFSELRQPLEPALLCVRVIILVADLRMTELVQYGTVQFTYKSGLCSFVQVKDKKRVSLMFNAAGRIPGEYPHVEGKSVKYMRFADLGQVEERADELRAITVAWCNHR